MLLRSESTAHVPAGGNITESFTEQRTSMVGVAMADRQFQPIYKDSYEIDLSNFEIDVYIHIRVKCTNRTGVYKLPKGGLKKFFGEFVDLEKHSLEDAIGRLHKSGLIKLYSMDGHEYVWLIDHFTDDRMRKTPNNAIKLLGDIYKWSEELKRDFFTQYEGYFSSSTFDRHIQELVKRIKERIQDKKPYESHLTLAKMLHMFNVCPTCSVLSELSELFEVSEVSGVSDLSGQSVDLVAPAL